jgi:drug/metabolite transporter (DMT)-like permease
MEDTRITSTPAGTPEPPAAAVGRGAAPTPSAPASAGAADRTRRLSFAAVIGGALCIAFAPIFVRLSEISPTATAFQRTLLALPAFALWSWRESKHTAPSPLDRRLMAGLLLCGFFFAGDLAAWHLSIKYTSVANATLLANVAPVIVTVAAWLLFRERITRTFLLGMLVGLSGAVLLVRGSLAFGGTHLLGDLLGILTAVFYAGYQVAVKGLRRRLPTARLMGASTAITCVFLLIMCLVLRDALFPVTLRGWLVVLGLAWVSQVAGQGLIAYGMAHLPASFSSVSLLVQPAAATVLAWALLGETLSWWQAAGGAAILGGILVARRGSVGAGAPLRDGRTSGATSAGGTGQAAAAPVTAGIPEEEPEQA